MLYYDNQESKRTVKKIKFLIFVLLGKFCLLFGYTARRLFASVYVGCGWRLQAVGDSAETADWLTQRADRAPHPN